MDKIFKVERDILLYALRYAIGRMTFAPTIVMDNIKANIDLFTESDIELIIRDIKDKEIYGYGMECDKKQWLGFIDYLSKELDLNYKHTEQCDCGKTLELQGTHEYGFYFECGCGYHSDCADGEV